MPGLWRRLGPSPRSLILIAAGLGGFYFSLTLQDTLFGPFRYPSIEIPLAIEGTSVHRLPPRPAEGVYEIWVDYPETPRLSARDLSANDRPEPLFAEVYHCDVDIDICDPRTRVARDIHEIKSVRYYSTSDDRLGEFLGTVRLPGGRGDELRLECGRGCEEFLAIRPRLRLAVPDAVGKNEGMRVLMNGLSIALAGLLVAAVGVGLWVWDARARRRQREGQ